MSIAPRLRWYLDQHAVEYEVQRHPYSLTSNETANRAHVPSTNLAKAVLLEDERGYVMAILPASRRIDLRRLGEQLHRNLEFASEPEIESLFHDCDRGAMPPVGGPYRIPTVYDDALNGLDEVWFEAGDHTAVVHLQGADFIELLSGSLHGHFSRPN